MTAWRIIPIPDEDAQESDLTSSELIGISIATVGDANSINGHSVYSRAWVKIQPQVQKAIDE